MLFTCQGQSVLAQSRYLLKKTNDNQWRYELTAHLSQKRPCWNCQTYCWKNFALRSPKKPPTSEGATAEKLGKWPVTGSAEMETEEGDKVKEDEEVEFDVVEGTVRVQQSCDAVQRIARHVGQTFEETDKKNKEKKTLRSQRKCRENEENR